MKTLLALILIALGAVGCAMPQRAVSNQKMLPALRPYVAEVAAEVDSLPKERKEVLGKISADVVARLRTGKPAYLTFICTHNSRRSHMSQIWAQTAAYYYGLNQVYAYSGGTEVTACNCRTVTAMRRVGFEITDLTTGDNPVYAVRYAEDRPPLRAYSKLYDADDNPKQEFFALMTCSAADRSCPQVKGAIGRYAIHYIDPKLCDDTPVEATAYNERCRQIAQEMFYIMAGVQRELAQPKVANRSSTQNSPVTAAK